MLPSASVRNVSALNSICVLLTYFNRKEKTIACFRAVTANALPFNIQLSAVVVDDGSTDGTSQALQEEFPWVKVEQSAGNLYWCRGMHRAFQIALKDDWDYYLWLNDDTILQPDALGRLLSVEAQLSTACGGPIIVVGSTVDENTGVLTYGGEASRSVIRRTRFDKLQPSDVPQRCDSMNGNVVLISRAASRLLGNLDPAFEHAMGDTDYALRARKLGVAVWTAPGVHGTCSDNPKTGTYMDASLPLAIRWKLMLARKGLPWRSWLLFTRRHSGPLWPLYFVWPYASLLLGKYGRK
jgi:GT2 family glycosyltransferase